MSTRLKRWIFISAALLACVSLALCLLPTPYERYYSQFNRDKMIGLTKAEVLDRVGEPTGIFEGEDAWNYQLGKSPGAVLLFTDGKVSEVSEWEGGWLHPTLSKQRK